MPQYIKATFRAAEQDKRDLLTALLMDAGFEGFEENDETLIAYINESDYSEDYLADISETTGVDFGTEEIPSQNWNALWESNFQPVIIDGFCTIRAHFHNIETDTPYEIHITPKMSFGTGHHATTQLMMMQMRDVNFTAKKVLDFGAGTGVLAILAELLGATHILAIDNDEWSVENTKENIERNHCKHISVMLGSLEGCDGGPVDIILANINRHVLLEHMKALYERLAKHGIIIMSGLLSADRDIIVGSASQVGFELLRESEKDGWISLRFDKK